MALEDYAAGKKGDFPAPRWLRRPKGFRVAMIRNLKSAKAGLLIATMIAAAALWARAEALADAGAWWDPAWKYCQTVAVITPVLSSGINTAAAEIDPMGKALPDGRDVRVVTAGKALVPHQVERGDDGVLRVLFEVPPGGGDTFFIYYGNPAAAAAAGQWEKRLGGLVLETRALIPRKWPLHWEQVQETLAANTPVLGRGPRPCINDNRNPFSGQQEHFLGIYKGKIFCPETGRYGFATNSDDGSFLFVDGRLVCDWPGAHDASINYYEHSGEVELQKGIHSIEYYLVQLVGAAKSFAGWKRPADKEYSMIPPDAFVQTLLTRVTAFREHQKNLSAYFIGEPQRQIRFNKSDRVFTRVAFRDCSTSAMAKVVSWRWDFGDGAFSTEQNPDHEFTQAGEYKVSLEVKDHLAYTSRVTRALKLAPGDPERVSVFFDTEPEENVLLAPEPFKAILRFRSSYPYPLHLKLHSSSSVEGRSDVQEDTNDLALERGAWQAVKKEFAARGGTNTVRFHLDYLGVGIAESAVRILPTALKKGALAVFNNSLLDSQGDLVVIRLGEPNAQRRPAEFSRKLAGSGLCTIVVVEDSLSPPQGKGGGRSFRDILKERLSARFPHKSFEMVRVNGMEQSSVYPPLFRLSRVESQVVAAKPDIVIWSCSLSDLLNYVPIETFNRYLRASVEMILAQTDACLLLASCPPVVVNPEMGHGYAFEMKKIALQYKVPSADLFSVFCRLGQGWKWLFREEMNRADPVFFLYPNSNGQELIAAEVFEKLTQ